MKDITPGYNTGGYPINLSNVDGMLFFQATDPVTVLAKDIYTGSGSSNPLYLANAGDIQFLSAISSVNGQEPWVMAVPATNSATIGDGATTTLQNVAITNNSGAACTLTVTRYPVPPGGLPADNGEAGVHWQISTDCTSCNFNLVFNYTDVDLARSNGLIETDLGAFRSTNGNDYSAVGGTVNTSANTITVTGVTQLSWWTLGNFTPTAVTLAGRAGSALGGLRRCDLGSKAAQGSVMACRVAAHP